MTPHEFILKTSQEVRRVNDVITSCNTIEQLNTIQDWVDGVMERWVIRAKQVPNRYTKKLQEFVDTANSDVVNTYKEYRSTIEPKKDKEEKQIIIEGFC